MGREAPMNTAPVGKPSITARDSVKSMGEMIPPRGSHGTGYAQVSSPTSTGSKTGAQATSKGKFSIAPDAGSEYRQVSSKG